MSVHMFVIDVDVDDDDDDALQTRDLLRPEEGALAHAEILQSLHHFVVLGHHTFA